MAKQSEKALGFEALIANIFATTITWWSVVLSFGFSMLVGVIFGVTPAIRASKLDPITALITIRIYIYPIIVEYEPLLRYNLSMSIIHLVEARQTAVIRGLLTN